MESDREVELAHPAAADREVELAHPAAADKKDGRKPVEKSESSLGHPAAAKSRLGRGLASLIPAAAEMPGRDGAGGEGVWQIAVASISPNSLQPRTDFDPSALEDLTQSVQTHGVLQPVVLRPQGDGRYELVAGERRFRAAQAAHLETIPALVREMTDKESLTVALIENIQREDLNAMEAARGYRQLIDEFGLTQSALAKQIGMAQPTIANALRLLKLAPEIQDSIADGTISEEHGKELLSISDERQRLETWRGLVKHRLSVAELRKAAANARSNPKDIHWTDLEDRLRSAFSMKVGLKPASRGKGGTLTIYFSDSEEIEGILDRLR